MRTLADMGFKEGDTIPLKSYIVLDFPEWFSWEQRNRYRHNFKFENVVEPIDYLDNVGSVSSYNDGEMLVVKMYEPNSKLSQWLPLCCLAPVINNKGILPKGV